MTAADHAKDKANTVRPEGTPPPVDQRCPLCGAAPGVAHDKDCPWQRWAEGGHGKLRHNAQPIRVTHSTVRCAKCNREPMRCNCWKPDFRDVA